VHARTGVPLDKIDVFLGDTTLPDGPTSGGSMATSAIMPAATMAVNQAVSRLINIATMLPNSPFHGAKPDTLTVAQGRIVAKEGAEQAHIVGVSYPASGNLSANGLPFEEILRLANINGITAVGKTFPSMADQTAKESSMKFEAVYCASARKLHFFYFRLCNNHKQGCGDESDSGCGGDGPRHVAV
jgi:xanthine dehydrogenase YagR molybdenum-binding subunit